MSAHNGLAIPLIHLNGSNGQTLLVDVIVAIRALGRARECVSDAAPNARDYYPMGDRFVAAAMMQHATRLELLLKVEAELLTIADDLQEQLDTRDALLASRRHVGEAAE